MGVNDGRERRGGREMTSNRDVRVEGRHGEGEVAVREIR